MKLKVTPEMFAAMQELVDEGYLGAAAFDIPELLHDWRVLSAELETTQGKIEQLGDKLATALERVQELEKVLLDVTSAMDRAPGAGTRRV